tara:strand:+ start:2796 stop:3257 length:462 start_codon:yes stop_codon:yes gene_type:complete
MKAYWKRKKVAQKGGSFRDMKEKIKIAIMTNLYYEHENLGMDFHDFSMYQKTVGRVFGYDTTKDKWEFTINGKIKTAKEIWEIIINDKLYGPMISNIDKKKLDEFFNKHIKPIVTGIRMTSAVGFKNLPEDIPRKVASYLGGGIKKKRKKRRT